MIGAFDGVDAVVSDRGAVAGASAYGIAGRATGGGAKPEGAAGGGADRDTGAPIGTSGIFGAFGAIDGLAEGASASTLGAGLGCGGATGACDGGADIAGGGDGGALLVSGRIGGWPTLADGTAGIACDGGGVGRRPGANGGTRVGVALLGASAGGVARAPSPGGLLMPPARSTSDAALPAGAADRPAADVRLAASYGVAKSSVQLRALVIGMIPPQTEQRARIPGPGTLAGSTRNTEWHSGHETFMTRRPG